MVIYTNLLPVTTSNVSGRAYRIACQCLPGGTEYSMGKESFFGLNIPDDQLEGFLAEFHAALLAASAGRVQLMSPTKLYIVGDEHYGICDFSAVEEELTNG